MTTAPATRPSLPVVVACVAAVVAAALVAAWISDDALVALRTVENLAAGEGFRWNIAERTQTATSPLWVLLLAAARLVTGEPFATTIVVSLCCTATAAWLLVRRAATAGAAVLVALAMIGSRAFTSFATSGLENPLLFVLAAALLDRWFAATDERDRAGRLRALGVLAGLLVLTRLDQALLAGPFVLLACRGVPPRRAVLALLPGALLVLGWVAFATVYFGTVVPTPGHAKAVALGLPPGALWTQGLWYLLDTCWRDPPTAVALLAAVVAGLRSRRAALVVPAVAIVLQLAYVVHVGGDFMAGRFLTSAFVVALAVLARLRDRRAVLVLGAAIVLGAALAPGLPPWLDPLPPEGERRIDHGIVDERAWYAASLSLWSPAPWPREGALVERFVPEARSEPMVALVHAAGEVAFAMGPRVHVVEPWICDPLLVRLPLADPARWRIGHFTRRIPEGYLETLASGENRIRHPALRDYWAALRSVLRDPVLDGDRLRTLWRFQLGRYDDLLARYVAEEYRSPPLVQVDAAQLAAPGDVPRGAHWFDRDCVVVREGGLRVRLAVPAAAPPHARALRLAVDGTGTGEVRFCRGGTMLGSAPFAAGTFGAAEIAVPLPAGAAGFDAWELHLRHDDDPLAVLAVLAVLGAAVE